MNLNAVRVFVKDVAEAKRFYAEQPGLRVTLDDLDHGVCIFEIEEKKFEASDSHWGMPIIQILDLDENELFFSPPKEQS